MLRYFLQILIFLSGITLVLPGEAAAYIDPGVASLIMQGLAAAALSVLVFWRNLRNRIKDLFTGRSVKEKNEKSVSTESE